ncbi:hypothetical protein [Lactococcus sp. S47]|uniref:hypothetical protein n=1 Tax=Lactococcus sp. S47 TaxID=2767460 RepID=UPI0019066B7E|nr:hypothetical protein [Lactococcus sp. S47]MBK0029266.1 hypothetical protein [Lactococcus sp. S47]
MPEKYIYSDGELEENENGGVSQYSELTDSFEEIYSKEELEESVYDDAGEYISDLELGQSTFDEMAEYNPHLLDD